MSTRATIRRVSYVDILGDKALLDAYAAECSIAAIGKINPQPFIYSKLEESGASHCFGVYVDELLIGFANVLQSVIPHYGEKVAVVESLFILSSHRAGGPGTRLMSLIEKDAKDSGCMAILYSAPLDSQMEALLDARYAYSHTNSVYCRSLV